MTLLLEPLLSLVVLANLALLATGRLQTKIRLVAVQGGVLALLPLVSGHAGGVRAAFLAVTVAAVKGALIPYLLTVAHRRVQVQRDPAPYVGHGLSLVFGVAAVGVAAWLGSHLPVPGGGSPASVLPVSLATLATGLFLIVARRTALAQVVGYLVLENGIYIFGVVLVGDVPALVELGVLLDVVAGVFIMGIAILHIQREFDHMDVGELRDLRG